MSEELKNDSVVNDEQVDDILQDTQTEQKKEDMVHESVPLNPVIEARHKSSVNSNVDISQIKPEWYILHTYSGYENLIKDNLYGVFEKNRIEDRLYDVVIPLEEVVEEKNGKRKVVQRKMFPGYVLIKMKYTRDMWHIIVGTRGVTGFVGPQGKPTPLTRDEVARMKLEHVVIETDLQVGDQIKVTQGGLSELVGEVKSINPQTGKCRVEVNMFGRLVPTELDISQVKKI